MRSVPVAEDGTFTRATLAVSVEMKGRREMPLTVRSSRVAHFGSDKRGTERHEKRYLRAWVGPCRRRNHSFMSGQRGGPRLLPDDLSEERG